MSLTYEQFNSLLICITAVVATIALLLLFIAYCRVRCGCCKRKHRSPSQHQTVIEMGTLNQSDAQHEGGDHDFDYIDDRSTNVISSTVRVTSLRNIEEVPKA